MRLKRWITAALLALLAVVPAANALDVAPGLGGATVSVAGSGAGQGTTSGTSMTGFGKQWYPGTVTGTVASGQQMIALFDSNIGTDTMTVIFLRRSTTCGNCLQVAFSSDGGVTSNPFLSTTLNLANTLQVAKRFPSTPPRYIVSADNGATAVIATSTSVTSGWVASTGLAVGDSLADVNSNADGSTVIATINENNQRCRSTNQGQAFSCAAVAGKGNGGIVSFAGGTTWLIFEGAGGNVWRSTDDGVNFALVTTFGSNAQTLRCLSPTYTTCITKAADGNVRLSTDGGATWPTIPLSGLGATAFNSCEAGTGVFSILSASPPVGFATISQNAFSSFNAGVAWFTGQTNGSVWDGTGVPSNVSMDCRNGKGISTYSTTGGGTNVFSVYNPLTQPGGVNQSSAGGYQVVAPIQAGIILNTTPTTSAANTAAVVTLTNVAGSRICIRRIEIFNTGAAGNFTVTVTDGATVVLNLGTLVFAAPPQPSVVREGSPLLCSQTNNNLVVNIGAGGAGAVSTTSVIGDRYPN